MQTTRKKMTRYDDSFRQDPWEYVTEPTYPEVSRLFRGDNRFWVSINQSNEKLFVIHVPIRVKADIPINLDVIEVEVVEFDSGSTRFLCTLKDENLLEIFILMIKDIAYKCKDFSDNQVIQQANKRLFSEWTQLLKPSRVGIGRSKQMGLWGEMFILHEYMSKVHPISDAVKFWVGPENKKQDFTLNDMALEVKTTGIGSTPSIKITSLEQLEKITERLYLIQIFINKASDDDPEAKSLQDFHDLIMEAIDDEETRTSFMLKAGKIMNKAKKSEKNEKYFFQAHNLYGIDDRFPIISAEDLPDAIRNVRYEINSSKITDLLLDEELENLIG